MCGLLCVEKQDSICESFWQLGYSCLPNFMSVLPASVPHQKRSVFPQRGRETFFSRGCSSSVKGTSEHRVWWRMPVEWLSSARGSWNSVALALQGLSYYFLVGQGPLRITLALRGWKEINFQRVVSSLSLMMKPSCKRLRHFPAGQALSPLHIPFPHLEDKDE